MKINQSPSDSRQRRIRLLLVLCLAITGTVIMTSFAVGGRSVQGVSKMKLSAQDPRPVAKAIEVLEAKYGLVITYEDPRYVHDSEIADVTRSVREDFDRFRTNEAPRVLIPKGGTLTIDYDVMLSTKQPVDPEMVVQQLLDTNSVSGNAGAFRLERSGQIMHVIPTASRNKGGTVATQDSVLDATITLPVDERTGVQTLEAICASVSQATQTRVVVGTIPLGLFFQHRGQQGASSQKARDVLVTLLESTKKGANLSWQLFHDPGMNMYVLNIHQVPVLNGKDLK